MRESNHHAHYAYKTALERDVSRLKKGIECLRDAVSYLRGPDPAGADTVGAVMVRVEKRLARDKAMYENCLKQIEKLEGE